jgi:hypothetical protein
MGMLVLLVEGPEVSISATASQHLARLGVSRVEVLRQAGTTAVVLEGWAFDPGSADGIAATVAPGLEVRTLQPLMRVLIGDIADESRAKRRT